MRLISQRLKKKQQHQINRNNTLRFRFGIKITTVTLHLTM